MPTLAKYPMLCHTTHHRKLGIVYVRRNMNSSNISVRYLASNVIPLRTITAGNVRRGSSNVLFTYAPFQSTDVIYKYHSELLTEQKAFLMGKLAKYATPHTLGKNKRYAKRPHIMYYASSFLSSSGFRCLSLIGSQHFHTLDISHFLIIREKFCHSVCLCEL